MERLFWGNVPVLAKLLMTWYRYKNSIIYNNIWTPQFFGILVPFQRKVKLTYSIDVANQSKSFASYNWIIQSLVYIQVYFRYQKLL